MPLPLRAADRFAVGGHHFLDQSVEFDGRRPAQFLLRLGIVALQDVDFRRPVEALIVGDVGAVIEPDFGEGGLRELATVWVSPVAMT